MGFKVDISDLEVFTLKNRHGMTVELTNFGGKIMSIVVPDNKGQLADVVLGYNKASDYINGNPFFGALIGRYGNRIANGKFSINGNTYQLSVNSRLDSLHGGPTGFHTRVWKRESLSDDNQTLTLSYYSRDGEEGFPGNLEVKVTYILTDQNELVIDYLATTDKTTIVNLSSHAFFNLRGEQSGSILDHEVKIFGSHFTPVREGLIPTGEIGEVKETPFDFREFHRIGSRIDAPDTQLKLGLGYDHNWVLDKKAGELSLAAIVREPSTHREMEVWTTEPGLQFYTGNFLDGSDIGKSGNPYPYRSGLCLEAQHFPDSPNQPTFPSTLLEPGDVYRQKTVYKFGVYN